MEQHHQVPGTRQFTDHLVFFRDTYKRPHTQQVTEKPTEDASLPTHKRMALFILGVAERIDFEVMPRIILGRFEGEGKQSHHLDLTDYGAINKGVSRVHCRLEFKDGKLLVTDLDSSNGTYVSGKRLIPHQPRVLQRGEELVIGRLPIQVVSGR